MKFAYADPPYLGCGARYKEHPDALDWDRTWMNWMREAKRRQRPQKPTVVQFRPGAPKKTWAEIKAERENAG